MLRGTAALTLLAAMLVGCGNVFALPSPTAGEIGDLVAGLVRRGATISTQVSGDAGCSDPTLYRNAVRYDLRLDSSTPISPVYVLRWKSQQTFDDNAAAFQACVDAFRQAHPGVNVTVYEDSPWRVYGPNWNTAVQSAVQQAVHAAAGASAPDEPE